MRDIVMSIRPEWVKQIKTKHKVWEFRNRIGKQWGKGTMVYVYETKNGGGCGKIVGKFEISSILCGLDDFQIAMFANAQIGYDMQHYAIGINNYTKFDKPIQLNGRPPESWRYVKEGEFERTEAT